LGAEIHQQSQRLRGANGQASALGEPPSAVHERTDTQATLRREADPRSAAAAGGWKRACQAGIGALKWNRAGAQFGRPAPQDEIVADGMKIATRLTI
jgi:hypothetical protein